MTKNFFCKAKKAWDQGNVRNISSKICSLDSKVYLVMGNITANLKSPISVLRLQIMINQEFELIITNKNLNELERDTLTVKNILSEMMEMETIKNQINKDVWEELE